MLLEQIAKGLVSQLLHRRLPVLRQAVERKPGFGIKSDAPSYAVLPVI
jgi:hypothetical protein